MLPDLERADRIGPERPPRRKRSCRCARLIARRSSPLGARGARAARRAGGLAEELEIGADYVFDPPALPATNTEMNAVAITPASGLARAAIGTAVGSVPVSIEGAKMLATATTNQMPPIATVNPSHNDRLAPGERRPNAISTNPVARVA